MKTFEAKRESAALVELRQKLTARGVTMHGRYLLGGRVAVVVHSRHFKAAAEDASFEEAAFAAVEKYDAKVAAASAETARAS